MITAKKTISLRKRSVKHCIGEDNTARELHSHITNCQTARQHGPRRISRTRRRDAFSDELRTVPEAQRITVKDASSDAYVCARARRTRDTMQR